MTPVELLRLHSSAVSELKRRKIVRTENAPLGDYAEWLLCQTFGWEAQTNSTQDVDAVGPGGVRYQIKARRLLRKNASRQLGALRRLNEGNFDFLAATLFDADYNVWHAAMIPHGLVLANSYRATSVNARLFQLNDDVWSWKGVIDISENLGGSKFVNIKQPKPSHAKQPRPYPKSGAGKIICDLIVVGTGDAEILASVKKQIPTSRADASHLAYYKTLLRNLGHSVPKKNERQ